MRLRLVELILFFSVLCPFASFGHNTLKIRPVNGGSNYSWLLDQAINCMTQDNNGYLWISTYGGILRYDGSEFVLMTHNPDDPSSLSDNTVRELVPDHIRGGIWICTSNGLDYFNPETGSFKHGSYIDNDGNTKTIKGRISDVMVLQDKIICCNGSRIYVCKPQGKELIFEKINTGFSPLSLCEYDKDKFLAANHEGVYMISMSDMNILSFVPFVSSEYSNNFLYYSKITDRIYVGNGIGTKSAAFRYEDGRLIKDNAFVPDDLQIVCDSNGKTVFGTNGNGIYIVEDGTISRMTTADGLNSDVVTAFCHDKQGNLWIGLYRGGIMLNQKSMEAITLHEQFKLASSVIPEKDRIYVGTDGYGLGIYDKKTGESRMVNTSNSALPGNNIVSMCKTGGKIWLGVYTKGLCSYDIKSGDIKTYSLADYDELYEDNNRIWIVINDSKGRIWVGGSSLFLFSKEEEEFRKIGELGGKFISAIRFKGNHAYVSTRNAGIFKIDINTLEVKEIYNKDTVADFPENDVRYVYVDHNEKVWFGTQTSGLYSLNRESAKIERHDEHNGLFNRNVTVMQEDMSGNIWLGTMNGLYFYSYVSGQFLRLGNNEYIPGQYLYSACSFDGRHMYFGSTDGLILFDTGKMDLSRELGKVCFNSLTTLSKDPQNIPIFNDSPVPIELKPIDNFFRISISIPEYIFPESIRFSCRLKGLEKDWRDIGNLRTITFTGLKAGEYDLEVRYSYIDSGWSTPSSMKIKILPEWYATWWAKTLWIFILIGALIILLQIYIRQQKINEDIRISEIEKKSIKEINEAKLDFFTRIIHELRTPIFLITSQLEVLTEQDGNNTTVPKVYLDSLLRNSKKLTKLINQLIDFRKLDSDKLALKLRNNDIIAFCMSLVADYDELCSKKDIAFTFECPDHPVMLTYDSEKIESILNNLVSNAFKYTKEGGFVKMTLSEDSDGVVFTVEDNGIGIMPENKEAIFENFARTERGMKQGEGDGIGLAVVKTFVQLHGGQICVESTPDVGSKFSFNVPFGLTYDSESSAIINDEEKDGIIDESNTQISISNPTAPHSILIIDDDHETANLMERYLESAYTIYKADNGEDGYKIAENRLPDLVICDLEMPGMDGHEFLTRLRKDKKLNSIKVIILTGSDSEEEMVRTLNEGADAHLMKPVSLKVLKIRISRLIASKETSIINTDATEQTNITKEEQMLLLKCREIIDEYICDEEFSMEFMAEKLAMSHSLLYKRIKSITGLSLIGFVNDYKIHKAILMFRQGEINVSTVCEHCGFRDEKNFRELFKRKTGKTPKQFVLGLNTKNTR